MLSLERFISGLSRLVDTCQSLYLSPAVLRSASGLSTKQQTYLIIDRRYSPLCRATCIVGMSIDRELAI